jgi:hypothetical protein
LSASVRSSSSISARAAVTFADCAHRE